MLSTYYPMFYIIVIYVIIKEKIIKEIVLMSEILEITMIICFGVSWPMNVVKSYRARTTKGKSLSFLCLIFAGYIAGIFSKFSNEAYMAQFAQKWYILFFYFLNLIMVGIDLCLYARNKKIDRNSGEK